MARLYLPPDQGLTDPLTGLPIQQPPPMVTSDYGLHYAPSSMAETEQLDPAAIGWADPAATAPITGMTSQRLFLDPSLNIYSTPAPMPMTAGLGDVPPGAAATTTALEPAPVATPEPAPVSAFAPAPVGDTATPAGVQTLGAPTAAGTANYHAFVPLPDYLGGMEYANGIGSLPAETVAPDPTETPAITAYKQKMAAYKAAKEAEGYVVREVPIAAPEGQNKYQIFADRDDPVSNLFEVGIQFTTNKGNPAKTKFNPSGVVFIDPQTEYRLTNEKGKDEVLYAGKGEEALKKIQAMALDLSEKGGKKANWGLETFHPNDGQWRRAADDDPAKNLVGDILKGAAFIGLSALTGGAAGIGLLGGAAAGAGAMAAGIDDEIMKYGLPIALSLTPLGPIAGAALGSAVGTAYNGGNLKEILMSAGISAATAGILKGTGLDSKLGGLLERVPGVREAAGALNGVVDKAFSGTFATEIAKGATNAAATSAATEAARAAAEAGVNEIVVLASNATSNAVAGIGGSLAGSVGGSAINSGTTPQPSPADTPQAGIGGELAPDEIVVRATRLNDAVSAMLAGAGITDPRIQALQPGELEMAQTMYEEAQRASQQTGGDAVDPEIVVRANKVKDAVAAILAGTAMPSDLTPAELDAAQAEAYPETKVEGETPVNDATAGIGGAITGDIVVSQPNPNTSTNDATSGVGGAVTGDIVVSQPNPDTPTEDLPPPIEVIAPNDPLQDLPPSDIPNDPIEDLVPPTGPVITDLPRVPPVDDGGGFNWQDWTRLALLAPGLLKGVFGGGGGGGGGNYNNGGGLPVISVGGIGGLTPRDPDFDPFTYGQNKPGAQKSEYLFFDNLDEMLFQPQTQTTPSTGGGGGVLDGTVPITNAPYFTDEAGQSYTQQQYDAAVAAAQQAYDAKIGVLEGYQAELQRLVVAGTITPEEAARRALAYARTLGIEVNADSVPSNFAEGGEAEMVKHAVAGEAQGYHSGPGQVRGIGSGQEDLIPAWLSDGEYVWSAQDVADLGDGSTDEGVRRLDKMRHMVRKQAGRKDTKQIAKPQEGIGEIMMAAGGIA